MKNNSDKGCLIIGSTYNNIGYYELKLITTYLEKHYGTLENVPNEVVIKLLCKAAEKGALDIVEFLHKKYQVDLNSYNNKGLTPLHYVVIGDHRDSIEPERKQAGTAKYLLDNGAIPTNTPNKYLNKNYNAQYIYDKVVIDQKSPLDIVQSTKPTFIEKIIGRTGSLWCDADRVRPVFERHLNPEKFKGASIHLG